MDSEQGIDEQVSESAGQRVSDAPLTFKEQLWGSLKETGMAPRPRTFDVGLAKKLAEPQPEPMRRNAEGFMPLNGQLLVRMCTREEMSETGKLYIPETAQEKPIEGIVIAASDGRFDAMNGRWMPSQVQAGDRCLFGKYSGATIVLRGEEMRLMQESELLGLIR